MADLLQLLDQFFSILIATPDKVVDDTHLDKIIDGLKLWANEEECYFDTLVSRLDLTNVIVQMLRSKVDATRVFGVRFLALISYNEKHFKWLRDRSHSDGLVCGDKTFWSESLTNKESSSMQCATLQLLQQVAHHRTGLEWVLQNHYLSTVTMCMRSSSFYVKKEAGALLALLLTSRSSSKGAPQDELQCLVNQLQNIVLNNLKNDHLSFDQAVAVIRKACELQSDWAFAVVPSVAELLSLLHAVPPKQRAGIIRLLSSLSEHARSRYWDTVGSETLLAHVKVVLEKESLSKGLELLEAFVFLENRVSQEVFTIYCNTIVFTIGFALNQESITNLDSDKLPKDYLLLISSCVRAHKDLVLVAVHHLKRLAPLDTCLEALNCNTKTALINGLLNLLSNCVKEGCLPDSTHLELSLSHSKTSQLVVVLFPLVTRLRSYCSREQLEHLLSSCCEPLLQNMDQFQLQVTCACLKCVPIVYALSAKLLLQGESGKEVKQVCERFSKKVQMCLLRPEWEIRDSCFGCVQDFLANISGCGDKLVYWIVKALNVLPLIQSALKEEEEQLRASAISLLSTIMSYRHLTTSICLVNQLHEVSLVKMLILVAISDSSSIVCILVWECLSSWCDTRDFLEIIQHDEVIQLVNSAVERCLKNEDHEVHQAGLCFVTSLFTSLQNHFKQNLKTNVATTLKQLSPILKSLNESCREGNSRIVPQAMTARVVVLDVLQDCISLEEREGPSLEREGPSLIRTHPIVTDSTLGPPPTHVLKGTLMEIVAAVSAADSKFSEADCY